MRLAWGLGMVALGAWACAGDKFASDGTGGAVASGGSGGGATGGVGGGAAGSGGEPFGGSGGLPSGGSGGLPFGGSGGLPFGGSGGVPLGGMGGIGVGATGGVPTGGSGGISSGGVGGVGGGTGGATACSGSTSGSLLLYTSMNDSASILSPSPGDPANAYFITNPVNDFVTGKCLMGLRVDGHDEYVRYAAPNNFKFDKGTIDFWYLPFADHVDGKLRRFFKVGKAGTGAPMMEIFKSSNDSFQVFFVKPVDGGPSTKLTFIYPDKYGWKAGVWVRITVTWDFGLSTGTLIHVYFNGLEPNAYNPPALAPFALDGAAGSGDFIYFGASGTGDYNPAGGVLDELKVYGSVVPPTPLT